MYAVITGASSGIGKEIAKLLAQKNYNLILVARREHRLQALKQKLEQRYSITVLCMAYDLSDRKQCIALYEACKDYPIKVVINNAGFGKTGTLQSVKLEDELSMIDTNITALHILTKLFATHMDNGYILNVASIAAFSPIPIMATYGATKSYVASYSRAMNYELRHLHKNVSITTLCPGPVDTEFNKVAGADFALRSITAKQCAKIALRGMFQRKEVVTPGLTTTLARYFMKITPTKLLLPIECHIQSKKTRL